MSIPVFKTAKNPSVFHRHDIPGICKYDAMLKLRADSRSLAGIEGNREIMKEQALPFLAQW